MICIERATAADAAAILDLQYRAYQSEAERYHDWQLPPLTQTYAQLLVEIEQQICLKATRGTLLAGSVRAYLAGDTGYIGRLIVAPAQQRQGVGTRLMEAIERALPEVTRFELFTGSRSEHSLALYHKLGYRVVRSEYVHPHLTLVYLEKRARPA